MGGATLCMRAVALLAAAGMFIFLAEGISADNDIAEAVAARVLEPTELVAEIPEEYGTLFQIQWGGGSLFQLAGRLAERGCAMNTLWVHDSGQWHPYNRYDVPLDAEIIQEFIGRYERDLPAGTFYATCADQSVLQNLQPTQIVAEIPEEYNTLFDLQWGGGSLLHLKGRLATMGCVANNITLTDPATSTQYSYNQYNSRSTDPQNQQFVQTFKAYLPAGAFQADCYNVCDVSDQGCLSFEELRKQESDFQQIFSLVPTLDVINFQLPQDISCTNDFHPQIKEQVLPHLPVHPRTCIIKLIPFRNGNLGLNGIAISDPRLNISPIVLLVGSRGYYRSDAEYETFRIQREIHEICHINQHWHAMQAPGADIHYHLNHALNENSSLENSSYLFKHFHVTSEHGQEFIDLIGFTNEPGIDPNRQGDEWRPVDEWGWDLPLDNIYRDIYSFSPLELSAELCAMYFLDKMGLESHYRYQAYYYTDYGKYGLGINIRDFDVSPYLNPEVVEWLEAYMILPNIEESVEEAAE